MDKDYRVELQAPDGTIVVSRSPADTVDLMYGRAYRVVTKDTDDSEASDTPAEAS